MFKNKFVVKNKNFLGSKDRKKLISSIKNSFNVENEELEELINKDETVICKIPSTKNTLYISKEVPVFFCVNNAIFPTVYTLWKLPKIIPCFVIYPPASEYLLRGADLMVPGICTEIEQTEKLKVGAVWGVRVFNNPHMFAVGQCLIDYTNSQQLNKLKGKCLKIMHVFHDELWKLGKQNIPDKSFKYNIIDSIEQVIDDFNKFKVYEVSETDNVNKSQKKQEHNTSVEEEIKNEQNKVEEKETGENKKGTNSFGWGSDEENTTSENEKQKTTDEAIQKIRPTNKYLENFYKHLKVIMEQMEENSQKANDANENTLNANIEKKKEAVNKIQIKNWQEEKRETLNTDFDQIEKKLNLNQTEEMLYMEMLKKEKEEYVQNTMVHNNMKCDHDNIDRTEKKERVYQEINLEKSEIVESGEKEGNNSDRQDELGKLHQIDSYKQEHVEEEEEKEETQANKKKFAFNATQQDTLLLYSLLEVLHTLNDNQLPMEFSGVFVRMITECSYLHKNEIFLDELSKNNVSSDEIKQIKKNEIKLTLDIKKSSFKKLGKFVQHCVKMKIVKVKENRSGTYLTNICRENNLFLSYKPVQINVKKKIDSDKKEKESIIADKKDPNGEKENEKGKDETQGEALNKGTQVLEFYMPTNKTLPIFRHVDLKINKSSYFNINQLKDIFKKFLTSEQLQNKKNSAVVTINETLQKALGFENNIKELPYEHVLKTFISVQQPCYAIIKPFTNFETEPIKVIKGTCPSIHIYAVARMGGSKWVTHVTNLFLFYLDLNKVSDSLQKQLACSCTVSVSPSTKKEELLVQGNVVNKISQILITQHFLPKKYIVLNSKGV